ncbi:hypothetical protein L1887_46824 [Cichorium endivia]|nr:hypothetical protein L1887_46824 [Cichorium endivia]
MRANARARGYEDAVQLGVAVRVWTGNSLRCEAAKMSSARQTAISAQVQSSRGASTRAGKCLSLAARVRTQAACESGLVNFVTAACCRAYLTAADLRAKVERAATSSERRVNVSSTRSSALFRNVRRARDPSRI